MRLGRGNARIVALLLATALAAAAVGAGLLHAEDGSGHRECAACRWTASTHALLAPVPTLADARAAVPHGFVDPQLPRSAAPSRDDPSRGPPLS
jgi:hypothetical protein